MSGPDDARAVSSAAIELLAGLEQSLAASLDPDHVVAAVARQAVPDLADWSVLELAPAPPATARTALVHCQPPRRPFADELEQLLRTRSGWGAAGRLEQTGRAEIVDGPLESWLIEPGAGSRLGPLLEKLGAASAMAVPLMARGALVGLLTLVSATPQRYRSDELALAAALGRRAATAIEHARRFQQAQRESTAKDELWGMAAHDLKNAVTNVLMRVALLLAADEDAARPHLASIERTARHIQRLAVDLLDSARLQSGQLVLARSPQSVEALVDEILDRFAPVAAERQIRLCAQLEPSLPPLVCDREQLLRLLANLVDNAIKFTGSGGSVAVRAVRSGGCLRLAVSDTGMGIAESLLPHLFERYWQRDRSGRGTGLGLYIARQIVAAHGGTIGVESEVGAGTRFFFTIPDAS